MISAVDGGGRTVGSYARWPLLPLRWMVLPTTMPLDETLAAPEYWRSECGAYAMPSQVPLLPEIFSPLLVVVTLAKNIICCEYGAKFMFFFFKQKTAYEIVM